MPEKNPYRPEELLYHMGHSTRAMNAFFTLDAPERKAMLDRIAAEPTAAQSEAQMEKELARLETIGQNYELPSEKSDKYIFDA